MNKGLSSRASVGVVFFSQFALTPAGGPLVCGDF